MLANAALLMKTLGFEDGWEDLVDVKVGNREGRLVQSAFALAQALDTLAH